MSSIGYDPQDNATSLIPDSTKGVDYAVAIASSNVLSGTKIGVLAGFFNRTSSSETDPVNALMTSTMTKLTQLGAEIVYVNDTVTYNATSIQNLDVQQFEYRELLSAYLSSPNLTGSHPRTMTDLYLSNLNTSNFIVIPTQYKYLQNALQFSTSDSAYATHLQGITDLTNTLHNTFSSLALDAIIYPEQKNLVVPIGSPSQSGRNGVLAAVTGSPVITIPIGFSNATDTAPIGVPVGMEILGMPWTEMKLLSIAKALDNRLHARRAPITSGLNEPVEVTSRYESVPIIQPSGIANIDTTAYPLGTFGTA